MTDTLLCYGDSVFFLSVQKIDDQSQQFLEFIMDQCRGFHNLLVVQLLGQNTCGHDLYGFVSWKRMEKRQMAVA